MILSRKSIFRILEIQQVTKPWVTLPLHPGTPLFLPSILLARPAEISVSVLFELFWIDKQLNYSDRIRLNQDCCLKCRCVVKLCKTATARNTPPRLLRFSALPVFWRGLLEQKPGTACYPPNINEINQQHETTQCSRLRGSLVDGQCIGCIAVQTSPQHLWRSLFLPSSWTVLLLPGPLVCRCQKVTHLCGSVTDYSQEHNGTLLYDAGTHHTSPSLADWSSLRSLDSSSCIEACKYYGKTGGEVTMRQSLWETNNTTIAL